MSRPLLDRVSPPDTRRLVRAGESAVETTTASRLRRPRILILWPTLCELVPLAASSETLDTLTGRRDARPILTGSHRQTRAHTLRVRTDPSRKGVETLRLPLEESVTVAAPVTEDAEGNAEMIPSFPPPKEG